MAILADGAVLTLADGTFDIVSFSHDGIVREAIDVSHLLTAGGKPYLFSDMYDSGTLTCSVQFANTGNFPDMESAAATTKIVFSDSTIYGGTAAVVGFSVTGERGGVCTGEIVLKYTGDLVLV